MTPVESFVPTVNRIHAGALDEGAGYRTWRTHGTTDWLLFHTTAGLGRLGTDGSDVDALPGVTLLIRPGTRHDYGVEPSLRRWAFLYAHFHPRAEWLPLLEWPEVAPGIMRIQPAGDLERRIVASLRRAARFSRGSFDRNELFAVNAFEEALLWCDMQNPYHGQLDERILRVLEVIEQRLPDAITLGELAAAATLSVSRFSHLFREQVGLSPREYLERQRLAAAAQLLELTNRSVSSIAAEVGFDNPLYFSTRFHRATGHSPSDYRTERMQR
jgi:AraC family transcriptional regulator, arabinose operon regulatory protein